ncbi:F-box only protein 15 [Eucyclogobius newberryi]|uniref:F-box only protein 15 n=1 Tax=Eucyclogobius newberryi TaxID=166745 RepID=UPI003B5A19D0
MASTKPVSSAVKANRTLKKHAKSSQPCVRNWIERLPCEILIKILSYLDTAALFTISHVSSLFYHLASDNASWHRIFLKEFGHNRKPNPKFVEDLLKKTDDVNDLAIDHWKRLYFQTTADFDMYKWKKQCCVVNRHTGLPSKTEHVLRNLHVTWQLTVIQQSKETSTFDLSWMKFSETSVTLCWSGTLPDLPHISALQLLGVRRIAFSRTGLKQPARRSLMLNVDMTSVSKSIQNIGQDKLVELKLLQPGIIVGLWKGQCSVAFVMFSLHLHRLVERSTKGSSVCPFVGLAAKPPFDDIDPEYGLHGYRLHISLHNTKCNIMSESFTQLFCHKTQMCGGLMQLIAINRNRLSEHTPLSGSISFPWRCEALQGAVQDCCIMTLLLRDEFKFPLWCVSSAVCLKADQSAHTDYNYEGDRFLFQFRDEVGQVEIHLVRNAEQETYTVVSLVIYITTTKINSHFGTAY